MASEEHHHCDPAASSDFVTWDRFCCLEKISMMLNPPVSCLLYLIYAVVTVWQCLSLATHMSTLLVTYMFTLLATHMSTLQVTHMSTPLALLTVSTMLTPMWRGPHQKGQTRQAPMGPIQGQLWSSALWWLSFSGGRRLQDMLLPML